MLICDELFLLLMKDSGTPEAGAGLGNLGLRGAVLADLVMLGRLEVEPVKDPRLRLIDDTPTGHPALDQALSVLPERNGERLRRVISWARLKPREGVIASLTSAGVIETTSGGLFKLRTIYPTRDPLPEQQTRSRLYAVLTGSAPAGEADVALLGIIQGMNGGAALLPQEHTGLDRRELKRRITEITSGEGIGEAVSATVRELSAVIAATTAVMVTMMASIG